MHEATCHSASTLSRFSTGTLSSAREGVPHFFPLVSFQSVSFNPTLILLSIEHTPENWALLEEVGSFAVNFSSPLGEHEATARPNAPRAAADGAILTSPTFHHPLDPGSAAWIECVIDSMIDTDDRIIVLASMIEMDVRETCDEALEFFADQYPPLTKISGAE